MSGTKASRALARLRKTKKNKFSKFTRLDAWARGQIIILSKQGYKLLAIRSLVTKPDGKTNPCARAVRDTLAHHEKDPSWRGENPAGPGRNSVIDPAQRKKVIQLVFKKRGRAIVTVKFIQKEIPALRAVSRQAVSRCLHQAGLQWLRRRAKRWMAPTNRAERMAYADWVWKQILFFLHALAYLDGTTFYLARCESESHDKHRRALGPFVWRMSSSKDGLYHDCVSSSLYAAKQGAPVKVWGYLAHGQICIHELPLDSSGKTTHMNGPTFRSMMDNHATTWKNRCWPTRAPAVVHVVMDHERCLRQKESLKCLVSHGMPALENFPKSSPDLNVIEQVWSMLRVYLDEHAPAKME